MIRIKEIEIELLKKWKWWQIIVLIVGIIAALKMEDAGLLAVLSSFFFK